MYGSPSPPALVIIDVQNAIDHPDWARHGPRNHPEAETHLARLLGEWRRQGLSVYHIRHDSVEPGSQYRPGQPGNEFKREVQPLPGETVVAKQTNSAFIGTGLEQLLRTAGHKALMIAGVITNNSVEATVRNAADLGFAVFLAEDAVFTFARRDYRGRLKTAEEVHALSLANLEGEYCAVVSAAEMIAAALLPEGQP